MNPERAHRLTVRTVAWLGRHPSVRQRISRSYRVADPALECRVAGLKFPNPVGLAAGFDKSGEAVGGLAAFGFGSIEVGSVSRDASAGNPPPRLWRLRGDQAVLVHYGVPNDGIDVVCSRLEAAPRGIPLGLNLVETNRVRPARPGGCVSAAPASADAAIAELAAAAARARSACDYFMLNLNCPNSGGGASPLNDPGMLGDLLEELNSLEGCPPVFLKPTGTEDPEEIGRWLGAAEPFKVIRGFAFNVARGHAADLRTPAARWQDRPGVVCGSPLRQTMRRVLAAWAAQTDLGRFHLIASGGISDADDAYERITLGASLLQLYTGLIYRGPRLVSELLRGLARRARQDGFRTIGDAVGTRRPST